MFGLDSVLFRPNLARIIWSASPRTPGLDPGPRAPGPGPGPEPRTSSPAMMKCPSAGISGASRSYRVEQGWLSPKGARTGGKFSKKFSKDFFKKFFPRGLIGHTPSPLRSGNSAGILAVDFSFPTPGFPDSGYGFFFPCLKPDRNGNARGFRQGFFW